MDIRVKSNPINNPGPAPVYKKSRRLKLGKLTGVAVWVIALVLLAGAASAAGYYYNRYHNAQKEVTRLSNTPQTAAQSDAQILIAKIGKLTPLPSNETPTVATVEDSTKLTDQPFFVNAKNGDRVLIYTQNKEAVLYRPSSNKLINIAPVNIGASQSGSSSGTTSSTKR